MHSQWGEVPRLVCTTFEDVNMTSPGTKISKRIEKELHQSKVIIRRLPPDFTEEKLKTCICPFPDHVYFYFCPGDPTLGSFGFSRAYVAFEHEEDIVPFRNQYDGLLLESERGEKYRAIVEFSPYQGVPKKPKRKMDARCGTVDKDPDYQSFMQSLESRPEPRPGVQLESYLEELETSRVADVQVTPLIEYLRDRMSGRGGKNRGRVDMKKKRKGELSGSKSKGYKGSKSGSGASGSKSRETSSKSKKEKDDGIARTGSSTKLVGEEGGDSKGGATQRSSSSSRQDRKEKYRGSEKRETEQEAADGGGDKESRRNKQRNRDRPDRSIYVPRSRNQGGGGGGERESREGSKDYHGRGGQSKQGRHEDANEYGGRPRSRGRGRGYRRNSGQPQESGY